MDNIQNLITDNLHIWSTALDEKKSGRGRGGSNKGLIYGVKKLRELILDLAVRGKLVPQDPNDEPASELLKRIAAEKSKEGDGKILFEIAENEGWVKCKLGLICSANTGYAFKSSQYQNSGTLVFRVTNINPDGTVNLDDKKYISNELADGEYNRFKLAAGDILLVMVGGTVGKLGIIESKCLPAVLNQNMWKLTSNSLISRRFFYLQLLEINRNKIKITASTHGHLSQGEYLSNYFSVPPLAEQYRIVAKVDELMKLCDDLEAGIIKSYDVHSQLVETLLNNLCSSQNNDDFNSTWQIIYNNFETLFTTEESIEKLKQSILQLAIMGKLVPQDPNDEPASELLKRIATEKQKLIAEGKLKKEKPLPPITDTEKPFDLPRRWCFTKLSELGEFGRGKSKHRPRNEPKLFQNGIYPLVQTGEVSRADWVINEYHSKYSDFGLAQSKIWPKNTLCITIAANIADAAILGFDACFPDSVVGLVCSEDNVKIDYIMYYMKTVRNDLIKFAPSTAQKNINLEILSQILVPIPPLNEQKRIVAKVEELMALCDELKSKITLANQTKITLANNISQQIDIA